MFEPYSSIFYVLIAPRAIEDIKGSFSKTTTVGASWIFLEYNPHHSSKSLVFFFVNVISSTWAYPQGFLVCFVSRISKNPASLPYWYP